MRDTLLVIEDENLLAEEIQRHFEGAHWRVTRASTLSEARRLLADGLDPLVVVSDMRLPDGSSLDFLAELRGERPHAIAEWVLLTGFGTVPDSVRALRLGAFDFLEKPCPLSRLELVVTGAARSARAHRRLDEQATRDHVRYPPDAFLGDSRVARETRALLHRLAEIPLSTLLLEGETGTGKGLAARILHHSGPRAQGPLVEVNCAALPRELMESELFGHEPGAFTGAMTRHRGLFEQAHGGTLMLDEIGDLEIGLQAKLLRAVEDRTVRRLGGEGEIAVDVQIFAASNHELARSVRDGTFRQDLLHRLRVMSLALPTLRDRIDDLEQLVPAFMAEFGARSGRRVTSVTPAAFERMRAYDWPGNVRELRNVIERSVLLSRTEVLDERWLQLGGESGPGDRGPARSDAWLPLDGSLSLDEMERRAIEHALKVQRYNVTAAARMLGVSRQTLRYRIEKHGLLDGSESADEDDEEGGSGG